jgi:peptide/nickel transport system permease protein
MSVIQQAPATAEASTIAGSQPRRFQALARELLHRPAGVIAASIIVLLVLVAIFAPAIAPHDPLAINLGNTLATPSSSHWLGTDSLGRDNFSRTLYGTRIALEIALPSVMGAFLIGALLGSIVGYLGGYLDTAVMIVFDAVISFPAVILGLALLTLIGPSIGSVILVIGIALVPYYGRLVRAQTLAERKSGYVKAERSLGASRFRVMSRHLFPNVLPPLLIIVAMDIPTAVVAEAGLAFLGLGVQPPTADWGVMLNTGFADIGTSPWEVVGPIVALILMTTAFTVLGETLRDIVDPTQSAGPGRSLFAGARQQAGAQVVEAAESGTPPDQAETGV